MSKLLKNISHNFFERVKPLSKDVKKYSEKDVQNFNEYCDNLSTKKWDVFSKLVTDVYQKNLSESKYVIEIFDIKKKFDEAMEFFSKNGVPNPFIREIKGDTSKGIIISSKFVMPAKGVMNLNYTKEAPGGISLYTIAPSELYFFHTSTGGLSVTIRQQQCEGLMKNEPELIFFDYFRRIEDVTKYDIHKAIRFFLLCDIEKSLYGKPTAVGRLIFLWVIKWRSEVLLKLFPFISKALSTMLKGK